MGRESNIQGAELPFPGKTASNPRVIPIPEPPFPWDIPLIPNSHSRGANSPRFQLRGKLGAADGISGMGPTMEGDGLQWEYGKEQPPSHPFSLFPPSSCPSLPFSHSQHKKPRMAQLGCQNPFFFFFFNPMEIQEFFRYPAPFLSRIAIKSANNFLGKGIDIYGIKG